MHNHYALGAHLPICLLKLTKSIHAVIALIIISNGNVKF